MESLLPLCRILDKGGLGVPGTCQSRHPGLWWAGSSMFPKLTKDPTCPTPMPHYYYYYYHYWPPRDIIITIIIIIIMGHWGGTGWNELNYYNNYFCPNRALPSPVGAKISLTPRSSLHGREMLKIQPTD